MLKKPAALQYILFALVAVAAIAYYIADAVGQYQYIWHGHERAATRCLLICRIRCSTRTMRPRRRGFTKAIGCWR